MSERQGSYKSVNYLEFELLQNQVKIAKKELFDLLQKVKQFRDNLQDDAKSKGIMALKTPTGSMNSQGLNFLDKNERKNTYQDKV